MTLIIDLDILLQTFSLNTINVEENIVGFWKKIKYGYTVPSYMFRHKQIVVLHQQAVVVCKTLEESSNRTKAKTTKWDNIPVSELTKMFKLQNYLKK